MRRLARVFAFGGSAGIVLGLAVLHAYLHAYHFSIARFWLALAFALILITAAYGIGLPDLPQTGRSTTVGAFLAALLPTLVVSAVQLALGEGLLPRFVVFSSLLLAPPWLIFTAALSSGGHLRAARRDRVVLVADDHEVERLKMDLVGDLDHPAVVVADLEHDQARTDNREYQPLVKIVDQQRATVVVLNRAAAADASIVAQAALVHERGVRIRSLLTFYEQWLSRLPVSELERASLMFDIGEIHHRRYTRSKRILDLAVASIGLVFLGVALPLVTAGNLVANRGPLLFRQIRVGKNNQPFEILKFRTMSCVPTTSSAWTSYADDRVTPFGGWLRRSHLDELPQVMNILRGELSLVGPRPEQPHYVEQLTEILPFYSLRSSVMPGLTGWAQVKYGYAGSESDAMEKLQFEFYYLRHQSLGFDIRILGRTIRSVVGRTGL